MMAETKTIKSNFVINQKTDGSCFKRIKSVFDISQSKRSMIKVRHTKRSEVNEGTAQSNLPNIA